jgi:hypothetical protein
MAITDRTPKFAEVHQEVERSTARLPDMHKYTAALLIWNLEASA